MLIEDSFIVNITSRNIDFYIDMGFEVKIKDKIDVTSSQLTRNNKNRVRVSCDYCPKIIDRSFQDHVTIENKETFNGRHACKDCKGKKTAEINKEFFGGVHASQTKEAKDKRTRTNLEKYGVATPFESSEIRDKGMLTTLEIYGVDNIFKLDSFHEIQKASMLEKYGYEHYSEDAEKQAEATRKRNDTMYKNGNAPSSRQQDYIHDIVGGELNYPVDSLMLDIAFPNERVYIEYQGSGHALDVLMGKMTKQEFKKKDINRYYYLKKQDWLMIEIISEKDHLPTKIKLLEMISYAKDVLMNSSYIVFDIDNHMIKVQGEYFPYDYEDLILDYDFRKHHKSGTYGNLLS